MKIKVLITALLAGFISLGANAAWDQFSGPTGELNLYYSDGAGGIGTYYGFSEWGVADLQSITSDNVTFELLPNINGYADLPAQDLNNQLTQSDWRNNGGAGPDGNMWLEATTLFRKNPIPTDYDSATLSFTVSDNDLDSRYEVIAFVRTRETTGDWLPAQASEITITTNGTYTLTIPSFFNTGTGFTLDAGFQMNGINANPTSDWGSMTITINELSAESTDFTAPTPDPMLWTTVPTTVSDAAITMTASNATDAIYDVEYLFTNTVNNTSSGWQTSPTWLDDGEATATVTNLVDIISDPTYLAIDSNWEGYDGGNFTPSTRIAVAAGVATVTPGSDGEVNFYQAYGTGTHPALTAGQAYEFSIVSENSTLTGTTDEVMFVKAFDGNWGFLDGEFQTVPLAMNGSTTTINFTPSVAGAFYQVGTYTIGATGGSYDVSSPSLTTTNIVPGDPGGLNPNTLYTYQVKARDTSPNLNDTAWSTAKSAKTATGDIDPPTPPTMSIVATDESPITAKLTAQTASDPSGVEYYFTCIAGAGNDSGWQSSPVYYDTGLEPGSNYSYTVIARDLSLAKNSNTVSAAANITTLSVASGDFNNDLKGFDGNTDDQDVLFELEKAGLTTGSENADAIIDLDTTGATFGDGLGASGRDLLKTIASDYQNVSFEAYATLEFSGSNDLSGFIGIGQGLQTGVPDNYGVPELNLAGVNGVCAQFKDGTAGSGIYNCNLFKFVGGDNAPAAGGAELLSPPVGSTETIRARLTYDAVAETVNVSFDKNYTGGAFFADQDMGTVSTTNGAASLWDGAPVHVYVGGGEGTLVSDFEVVVTGVPLTTFDLVVTDTVPGGGVVISWEGAVGQTYEVQYTTDLGGGSWGQDFTVGGDVVDLGGPMSVTSSVGVAEAFYRFILK